MHIIAMILTLVGGIALFIAGFTVISEYLPLDPVSIEQTQQEISNWTAYMGITYGSILIIIGLIGIIAGLAAFFKKKKACKFLISLSFFMGVSLVFLASSPTLPSFISLQKSAFSIFSALILYGIASFFAWLAVRPKRVKRKKEKKESKLATDEESETTPPIKDFKLDIDVEE